MPTSPAELLNLCKQLSADTNFTCEATSRAIASRAYYSSYHTALKIIDQLALPETTDERVRGSHQRNLQRLIECIQARSPSFMAIRKIGYMASFMHSQYRVPADYFLTKEFSESFADECLAKAEKILDETSSILG